MAKKIRAKRKDTLADDAEGSFLLSADDIEELCDVFLAEVNGVVVHDEAWHAHDIVFFFQIRTMVEVVYVCADVRAKCRDMLRRDDEVRAHGARERYDDLDVDRSVDGFDACFERAVERLTGSCGVVETEDKGCEFVPAGYTVEGKACIMTARAEDFDDGKVVAALCFCDGQFVGVFGKFGHVSFEFGRVGAVIEMEL